MDTRETSTTIPRTERAPAPPINWWRVAYLVLRRVPLVLGVIVGWWCTHSLRVAFGMRFADWPLAEGVTVGVLAIALGCVGIISVPFFVEEGPCMWKALKRKAGVE